MSKSKTAAAAPPLVINEPTLPLAWSRMFTHITDHAGTEISPLIISFYDLEEGGVVIEKPELKRAIDELLEAENRISVEDVAFTIFPQRYWEIAGRDRSAFFDLYQKSFPRIQSANRSSNGRGLYFERLTMYPGAPEDGNQLEWIISQFSSRDGVRRSMFQASVFDPARDHVANAQLQFPCLQHVSFEPTKKGLVMNAFYATQQVFDKSYGNYLGLSRLGLFMAEQMQLRLARVNIMVGVAKLERTGKQNEGLSRINELAHSLLKCADEAVK